ncbi:MAG: bifunctional phosphoribosyl-AMP cyclohydrolase/phosphoribosyl-ATP diphosphatase HisIE [Burkholderiales bacterium]|jgi:phosphoribosyl-ATP pyrophosphohydrolase/phosphoribosyl-AMP cyclohydrolase|nr:bifunctional phosphoribosyl-AMP cyclohydrolase/phosphoribosyl-ATP diphosphatase HisIE [Burkholderiales bacterium]
MLNVKLYPEQRAKLAWGKSSGGDGLLPAIVQHAVSGEVLMLGFMNEEALAATEASGRVTFYSRSKGRLWTKGETSNHFLNVVEIAVDCDHDALLILAWPEGPACHCGTSSCFSPTASRLVFLYELEQLLAQRKHADPESSYTARLYAGGTKRIAQKVGEEAVEIALAAMANDREELTNEAADLVYHLLVLLQDRGLDLDAVVHCLKQRHK